MLVNHLPFAKTEIFCQQSKNNYCYNEVKCLSNLEDLSQKFKTFPENGSFYCTWDSLK